MSVVSQRIFRAVGLLMFSIMFSRRAATSVLVRAFNTGSRTRLVTQRIDSRYPNPSRWLTTAGVARVAKEVVCDPCRPALPEQARVVRVLKTEHHLVDRQGIHGALRHAAALVWIVGILERPSVARRARLRAFSLFGVAASPADRLPCARETPSLVSQRTRENLAFRKRSAARRHTSVSTY